MTFQRRKYDAYGIYRWRRKSPPETRTAALRLAGAIPRSAVGHTVSFRTFPTPHLSGRNLLLKQAVADYAVNSLICDGWRLTHSMDKDKTKNQKPNTSIDRLTDRQPAMFFLYRTDWLVFDEIGKIRQLCEYGRDGSIGWNSTFQAAWYVRQTRSSGVFCFTFGIFVTWCGWLIILAVSHFSYSHIRTNCSAATYITYRIKRLFAGCRWWSHALFGFA